MRQNRISIIERDLDFGFTQLDAEEIRALLEYVKAAEAIFDNKMAPGKMTECRRRLEEAREILGIRK